MDVVHLFQIPELSHFLTTDREWNNWALFTINLIAEFEDNASYEYWSKQAMVETIADLQIKYDFIKSFKEYDIQKITDPRDVEILHSIQQSSVNFFHDPFRLFYNVFYYNLKQEKDDSEREKKRWCSKLGLRKEQILEVLKKQYELYISGQFILSGEIAKQLYPAQ